MSAELVVAPCSYKAAKYAVEHWHYSQTMPSSFTRLYKLGVWENGAYRGAVIFSHGSNKNIGSPYGLSIYECVELVRVALSGLSAPVSKVVSLSLSHLRQSCAGLRLVVSYADIGQGHFGIIYQAGNWVYVGLAGGGNYLLVNGKTMHKKAVWASFGTNKKDSLGAKYVESSKKHKYLYPLDRAMRRQIAPLAQPYPKADDARPVNSDNAEPTAQAGAVPAGRSLTS